MVERVILGQPGVNPVVVGSRVTSYIVQDVEFDFKKNNEYDPSKLDDWLFWGFYGVYMPVSDNVPYDVAINVVGKFLTALWEAGLRAVAVGEHEEELPNKGGAQFDLPSTN
jgi:hypothetical protein